MELLSGRTLAQWIEHAGGRLPWRKAVEVMVEVLDVLTVAHERGVVHCDIKPSNIFICQDERVKPSTSASREKASSCSISP